MDFLYFTLNFFKEMVHDCKIFMPLPTLFGYFSFTNIPIKYLENA